MLKVVDLRINNQASPIGTDDANPEFSWRIEGDERQENYRLTVSETPDYSRVVWDSGVIESSESLHVSYQGKGLKSCQEYFWKVVVNSKQVAESLFETAFLDAKNEFSAYWIGQPLSFAGSVDDIRLDFEVKKPVKKARFYIAMLGTGKVYLNGKLLDDCYFDGGISVYSKSIGYRTYKLSLQSGNNALCMRIGCGFYGAKKFYGLLRVEYDDGEVFVQPTIAGRIWNVKKDEIVRSGVYDGEIHDAGLREDWTARDYKVHFGNWVATFAVDAPKGQLKAIAIPPMRVADTFPVLSVKEKTGGYMVDVGVNICGFLRIKATGEAGAVITVTHAERLDLHNNLDNANYRAAENKNVYILGDKGEYSFAPQFTYRGFRYAEIALKGKVNIESITACVLRTDIPVVSEFECSDETLNKLHEIAVRTEGNNLNGTFTDCPQRDERLGWLNDLSSRLYQSVNNYAMENYLPNFTDMTTDSQYDNGAIPDTVPFAVGCMEGDPVSAYTLDGLLAYTYYGDIKTIARNYEGFNKWVSYLKGKADAGGGTIQYGYYGDWCPPATYANGTKSKLVSDAFISSAYFLWYLKQMSLFARLLSKKADEKRYKEDYSFYRKKFDLKYYDKQKRIYGSGSQTELAVCTTIFDEDRQLCKYWMQLAADDIAEREYHLTCGNQGYRHLLYNLAEYGFADTVIKVLKNKDYPGWGFMLECGATTVWERWENKLGDDMHSFNHPMFSGYDGFFINYLAGIRADLCENCFEKIVIKPCFVKQIDRCKARFRTLRGQISVEWKRSDGRIELLVSVPVASCLKVIADDADIYFNNKKSKDKICVGGGQHCFVIVDANGEK